MSSCRLHHGDLLVMDGRCQDEYLHCTGPGLADKRMNIKYRWIGYHTLSCPLAAGVGDLVLGTLLFPDLCIWGCCGFVLRIADRFAQLAFRRTGCGSPATLFWQFCPLGINCWFWTVLQCWQQSWVCKGWTGKIGHLLGFFGSGDWLPCVPAWWVS